MGGTVGDLRLPPGLRKHPPQRAACQPLGAHGGRLSAAASIWLARAQDVEAFITALKTPAAAPAGGPTSGEADATGITDVAVGSQAGVGEQLRPPAELFSGVARWGRMRLGPCCRLLLPALSCRPMCAASPPQGAGAPAEPCGAAGLSPAPSLQLAHVALEEAPRGTAGPAGGGGDTGGGGGGGSGGAASAGTEGEDGGVVAVLPGFPALAPRCEGVEGGGRAAPLPSPSPSVCLFPCPRPSHTPCRASFPLRARFLMGLSLGGGIATHLLRRTGTKLVAGGVLLAPMISLQVTWLAVLL